jgi:transposase-like protein
LAERRRIDLEGLVPLLDGMTLADDEMVIALGATTTHENHVLGLVLTATENEKTCAAFLRASEERAFASPKGLLVVLDGARGLRAAVREPFGDNVPVQRCQWHKRENVMSSLAKPERVVWRHKLQAAYAQPSYVDEKSALQRLLRELEGRMVSAARSLQKVLDETLALDRLGVHREFGISLSTTNLTESAVARVEARTRRVDRWRTSNQKLRWCVSSLLHIRRGSRPIKGCKQLHRLQRALHSHTLTPNAAV